MELTEEKIHQVVEEAVGKEAIPIVDYLNVPGRKDISDFEISDETGIDMKSVRRLLYKLHGSNIVTYIRKKSKEKGWYISYFTFNPDGVEHMASKLRKEKLQRYKDRLKREQNGNLFFLCPNLCTRLDMDTSMQYDFRCPECGSLLNQQDNSKTIERLQEKIKELEAAT